jgi:hypothetical protein
MNETWLAHHGIKGQRWGVRRFQNPDGTLTEAGKKKYGSQDNYDVEKLAKKRTKDLTNDELRKIAERRNLEKAIKKGDAETNRMLIESGTKILTTAAIITAAGIGAKYTMKHLPEIAGYFAKQTTQAGANVAKETAKVVANEAANAAGKAAKTVAKAGHDARKNIASTSGARAYVKAVDTLLGKRKKRK